MLPKQSDIVIFDREGCDEITEYIVKYEEYIIVDSHIKYYYLNPYFIIIYLKNLIFSINSVKNLLSIIYKTYFLTIINFINPKIVITYIDDNMLYHWLSKHYKGPTYIAIQNGIRQKFHKKLLNKEYCHEHFYCFGEYDLKKHNELGHQIKYGHPIGSLRSGIFFENQKNKFDTNYDICLISMWINPRKCKNNKLLDDINKHSHQVNINLAKYAKKNNKKISIALRTSSDEEYNYYFKLFDNSASIFKYNHQKYSSYNLSQQSNLTVSFMSTSVLEALALNKKALFIDTSMTNDYVDYDDAIRYKFSKYNDFEKKINYLLDEPYDQYLMALNNIKKNAINLDLDNLPQQIIKNHLLQILNKENEPKFN